MPRCSSREPLNTQFPISPRQGVPAEPRTRRPLAGALVLMVACAVTVVSGCQLFQIPAYMEESRRRSSTRTIEPEYTGLQGKSFAVVVDADMFIQADDPRVVPEIMVRAAERLREHAGGSAYIPGQLVMAELLNRPGWSMMNRGELAKMLGVERLVVIELQEYRLRDRGNRYVWNAVASGAVAVYEADSNFPDEAAFRRAVRVRFPNTEGESAENLNADMVNSILLKRFLDRSTWPMYRHEEPYYPEY